MRCFPLCRSGSASFFRIGLGLPSISREDNGCVSRLLFAEWWLGPDLIFTCHRSPAPPPVSQELRRRPHTAARQEGGNDGGASFAVTSPPSP